MLQSRIGRVLASAFCAAALVAALGTPANAKAPGIACSTLTGSVTGKIQFKKCTGNTGGSSKKLPAKKLVFGGTITWKNGKSTAVTLSTVPGDNSKCASGSSEFDLTGNTTSDTTGSAKLNGKVKASVCVTAGNEVSLVKGTKATIQ